VIVTNPDGMIFEHDGLDWTSSPPPALPTEVRRRRYSAVV
jgi:hypothetical protein